MSVQESQNNKGKPILYYMIYPVLLNLEIQNFTNYFATITKEFLLTTIQLDPFHLYTV